MTAPVDPDAISSTPGEVWRWLQQAATQLGTTRDWACRGELVDVQRRGGGWVTATVVGDDGARFRMAAPPHVAAALGDYLADGVTAAWVVQLECRPEWGELQLRLVSFVFGSVGTGDRGAEAAATWTLLEPYADVNRQAPVAATPARVAVITAEESAAWADVQAVADDPRITLRLLPTPMAGPAAAAEIAARLRSAAVAAADVVVVARGGGDGREWADDPQVAWAIVDCPRQVWTAIGHASDVHIADEVAARSFATPSAAAAYLRQLWAEADAAELTAPAAATTPPARRGLLPAGRRFVALVMAAVVVLGLLALVDLVREVG